MVPALLFILAIMLALGITARVIWLDARRTAPKPEPTELGLDAEAEPFPFRSVGSHADEIVRKLDRRRA